MTGIGTTTFESILHFWVFNGDGLVGWVSVTQMTGTESYFV